MKKEDFYSLVPRKDAYLTFLASGETDTSLLPTPLSEAERFIYALCLQNVKEESKEPEVLQVPASPEVAEEKPVRKKRAKKEETVKE